MRIEDSIYITENPLSYSDREVQNATLLLDSLAKTLGFLVGSPIHESWDRIQKGVPVPLRVENNLVCNQTRENLTPAELEIPLLVLFDGIVELIFVEVENLGLLAPKAITFLAR